MIERMSGSTDDTMITPEEAFDFVRDALCIPAPSTKFEASPKDFLQDLLRAYFHHIPFQNLKNIATPHRKRHVPTVAEIKQDILTDKIGGLCYQQNVFFYLLLQALGFDVTLIACDIEEPSDHAAVIVHNLTSEGSRHYADVGNGNPYFCAVPFDFKDESPVYHESFLRFKFSRQDDVIFCLHQVDGHPAKQTMEAFPVTDGWYRFIRINFKRGVEVAHFKPSMTPRYVSIDDMPRHFFLTSLRCMAFPDGRFVCISNTTLLIENEPGCISKSYFRSRKEIKEAFAKYFPQISQSMLDEAMNDDYVKLDYKKGIL
ncbi:uncharacterized protein LOC100893921 [Strongylocentrotus purpuratus]|uniref:arylamine N-acetyltransferase n=1 Tax=Strongylocentrotus purpuratus TaxID=7668 RepID=A0A7M7P739_STRPU|nr:uncharacterized protein LOC100893921 [Strongylocentrotus purpuratus]